MLIGLQEGSLGGFGRHPGPRVSSQQQGGPCRPEGQEHPAHTECRCATNPFLNLPVKHHTVLSVSSATQCTKSLFSVNMYRIPA